MDRLDACFQIMDKHNMHRKLLLLDSCSTVNLFADPSLVHGIHKANRPLMVKTYGGVKSTDQKAYVGRFPEPVWYDPTGVANVMALASVQKHYRVTFDSAKGNTFVVHLPAGEPLRFTQTTHGLYALSLIHI